MVKVLIIFQMSHSKRDLRWWFGMPCACASLKSACSTRQMSHSKSATHFSNEPFILFKWAIRKETCGDYSGFWFPFWWPFELSTLRERAVWIHRNRPHTKKIAGTGCIIYKNRPHTQEAAPGALRIYTRNMPAHRHTWVMTHMQT